ncbi:MAG: hypothetical protein J6U16_08680 [Ruminococcus sp.]|nr:hypothetical protein [Ruminococcus sp.]
MKKMNKAALAVLLAGAMLTAVSCGSKESSSSSSGVRVDGGANARKNMTDEEYRSTYMTNFDLTPSDDENIKIMVSFDNRFLGNEGTDYSEIYLVDNYFDALNNNDIQGVLDCYYPDYLESLCGDGTFATPEDFVKEYREQLQAVLTDNFKFDFIEISNCQLSGDLEADTMFANRDETLKAAFGEDIANKISDRKMLTIAGDSYITADGEWAEVKSLIPEGIIFCVYTIDGKPYIF